MHLLSNVAGPRTSSIFVLRRLAMVYHSIFGVHVDHGWTHRDGVASATVWKQIPSISNPASKASCRQLWVRPAPSHLQRLFPRCQWRYLPTDCRLPLTIQLTSNCVRHLFCPVEHSQLELEFTPLPRRQHLQCAAITFCPAAEGPAVCRFEP